METCICLIFNKKYPLQNEHLRITLDFIDWWQKGIFRTSLTAIFGSQIFSQRCSCLNFVKIFEHKMERDWIRILYPLPFVFCGSKTKAHHQKFMIQKDIKIWDGIEWGLEIKQRSNVVLFFSSLNETSPNGRWMLGAKKNFEETLVPFDLV